MKTRGAVLWEIDGDLEVLEVDIGPLPADHVMVEVHASGVCGSDLSVQRGIQRHSLPAVLGHEGAGIVTHVGSAVESLRPGDFVVITWALRCGSCAFCQRGDARHCVRLQPRRQPHLTAKGREIAAGSGVATLAERTMVPASGVVPISPEMPLEYAALLGCCVSTGVGAALRTAQVTEGSTVLVIGAGAVGVSAVQGARLAAADAIAVCEPIERRRLIAAHVGATWTGASIDQALAEVTEGFGFDYVLDIVGSAETIRSAWDAARPGGTVVVVGVGRANEYVQFSSAELHKADRKLSGCVYGSTDVHRDIPDLVTAWEHGLLDLEPYVSQVFDLDDVNEAFAFARRGDGLRSIVRMPAAHDLVILGRGR